MCEDVDTMQILIQNRQRKYPVNETQVSLWVRDILEIQKKSDAGIGLVFVNNRTIRKFNRDYRGKDAPTDVLSFPMREAGKEDFLPHLGDIMISLEKTYEEAHLFHHNHSEHLLFLLIHGILHLLGYDHEESRNEEARMKRREKRIFERVYKLGRKSVPTASP